MNEMVNHTAMTNATNDAALFTKKNNNFISKFYLKKNEYFTYT